MSWWERIGCRGTERWRCLMCWGETMKETQGEHTNLPKKCPKPELHLRPPLLMPVSIHSLSKASWIIASLLSPSLSTSAQSAHGKCSLSADSSKRRYLKPILSSCLHLSWHLYKQETTCGEIFGDIFWWDCILLLGFLRKVANRTRFGPNHALISPVTEWHVSLVGLYDVPGPTAGRQCSKQICGCTI